VGVRGFGPVYRRPYNHPLVCALTLIPMKNSLLSAVLFVASALFASSVVAQEVKGNVTKGESKAAMCIGCHGIVGYQASFPEIHKVPMIAGQNAEYIVAALTAYNKGERKHPTMRATAGSLTEQDMADLGAFYQQQAKDAPALAAKTTPEPSPKVAELLKKAACISCHGDNFSKPISPTYPKLAGQHADYLYVALKAYQTKNNPQVGRGNAVMSGMSGQYTHAELKLMADYIASLPSDLRVVPQSRFR
jgi:cytochrome c553